MKTETIHLFGKPWRIHKQTETRIVLMLASNPLAKWRSKNKLNQRQAAERLGISQTHLAKIEIGTRSWPSEVWKKIHAE